VSWHEGCRRKTRSRSGGDLSWASRCVRSAARCSRARQRSVPMCRRVVGARPQISEWSPVRLSMTEREEISRELATGSSLRAIARRLSRAPSTISREVTSNGGRRRYRAAAAHDRSWVVARRPRQAKLACSPRLRAVVEDKLAALWSPQQIAGWLRGAYPNDPEMWVSHETIYLSLFVQARGALRRAAATCTSNCCPVRAAISALRRSPRCSCPRIPRGCAVRLLTDPVSDIVNPRPLFDVSVHDIDGRLALELSADATGAVHAVVPRPPRVLHPTCCLDLRSEARGDRRSRRRRQIDSVRRSSLGREANSWAPTCALAVGRTLAALPSGHRHRLGVGERVPIIRLVH
jgi:DNA-binding CsgD family transcriptional regulator